MSDDRSEGENTDVLAGEFALGVLTNDELKRARDLAASDPHFRTTVSRWTGRLARLLLDIPAIEPPESSWIRIATLIGSMVERDNVLTLRRKLNQWRGAALGTATIAACLGLFLVFRPPTIGTNAPPPAAPMVALLSDGQESKIVASWDPIRRQLILAVAGTFSADQTHSHELWVIPSGRAPVSLGILPNSDRSHIGLAASSARLLQDGATIAISKEPLGGSPSGSPTGPVVASGVLKPA